MSASDYSARESLIVAYENAKAAYEKSVQETKILEQKLVEVSKNLYPQKSNLAESNLYAIGRISERLSRVEEALLRIETGRIPERLSHLEGAMLRIETTVFPGRDWSSPRHVPGAAE